MSALIRSEFRKLFSTKAWIGLLLGAMALTALSVSLLIPFAGDPNSGLPALEDPLAQQLILSTPANSAIFVVILGIMGITQEFRHRTATPTFLTTPSRVKVVVAKLITYLVIGLGFAVVTLLVVLAIAIPWLASRDVTLSLGGDNTEVVAGALAVCTIYALVGVGVGTLVRNQVGAIVGILAYLFVAEPIIRAVPATADFYRWLPGGAVEAMTATFQNPELLGAWQGAALLIGYGLVAAGLAMALTLQRDVH
ncbi:ABC transporter permease [soil metagenome]